MTRYALVCGAGGFIGGHLVKWLKREGCWVRGIDLKFHGFSEAEADDFVIGDLGTRAPAVPLSTVASMRCISSLPTWVAQGISLPANTMPR
jgi:nucleoside-diphosphate-sugar epimerase